MKEEINDMLVQIIKNAREIKDEKELINMANIVLYAKKISNMLEHSEIIELNEESYE